MAWPVKTGTKITAQFRQTSSKNWKTCGYHTGTDFGSWDGDPIYAVEDGNVWRRFYGPAFGLTLALSPDAPGEWQYSHLQSIDVPNGAKVKAGDRIATSGRSGDVPPHLHLEWKPNHKGVWRCGIQADPVARLNELAERQNPPYPTPISNLVYLSKLKFGQKDSDSVWYLQRALKMPRDLWTGFYGPLTDDAVRDHQAKFLAPADPEGKSFVGPRQAALLFGSSPKITVIDDISDDSPKDGDRSEVRATTFNWPPRYKTGGLAADKSLWSKLVSVSDIFAAQEARWLYSDVLKGTNGWALANPRRSNNTWSGEVLGWREAMFETIDVGQTLLSPATPIQREAAGPTTHNEKWINWADLRHRDTGQMWNIACVHFVPSKHIGGAALQLWHKQLRTLVAWMERQTGDVVVVMGDFNAKSTDKDADLLREIATISSSRSHGLRDIDWVVVRKDKNVSVSNVRSLDNEKQSDHKPVSATITVTKQKKVEPEKPTWWKAKAGVQLFAQVDALWPNRDRRTDGTIGDIAHCGPGKPPSEHCPDPETGVVRAIDIDADLGALGDSQKLADAIVAAGKKGDPRLWYVIHNGRIRSKTYGWADRPYSGSNPHTSHIHVSFTPAGDNDDRPFDLSGPTTKEPEVSRQEFDALVKRVDALFEKVGALETAIADKNVKAAKILDDLSEVFGSK